MIVRCIAVFLSMLSASAFAKEPQWAPPDAECTKAREGDVKLAPAEGGKNEPVAYRCVGTWKPVPLGPAAMLGESGLLNVYDTKTGCLYTIERTAHSITVSPVRISKAQTKICGAVVGGK